MKPVTLVSLLLTVFVLLSHPVRIQAASPTDAATEMLKEFYTKYITEISKTSPSAKKLQSIKKQYCTAGLLSRMKELELDYDPFINAQDTDDSWIKTLSVKKDPKKGKGLYTVSFSDTESKTTITVRLSIVKDGDDYKIDGIAAPGEWSQSISVFSIFVKMPNTAFGKGAKHAAND